MAHFNAGWTDGVSWTSIPKPGSAEEALRFFFLCLQQRKKEGAIYATCTAHIFYYKYKM